MTPGTVPLTSGLAPPKWKKSYAISMILQDNEKTLNDKQIDAIMNKIIKNLETQLGAKLR